MVNIVSQEDFDKAQAYGTDKARFGFVAGAYSQAETTVFILFGALPWLWTLSGTWMARIRGYGPEYEVSGGMMIDGDWLTEKSCSAFLVRFSPWISHNLIKKRNYMILTNLAIHLHAT